MSEVLQDRLEAEIVATLDEITAADLEVLVGHIQRFGIGHELDALIRIARPGAKVQPRFLPAHVRADILKSALRTPKALELVQDVVVGLYADELGDAVNDPSLAELESGTTAVLAMVARPLVKLTLLGVVYRDEVAKAHAISVLREQFACDLTK